MKINPIDLEKGIKVSELVDKLSLTAFNARRLGNAGKIWKEMVKEDTFVFLTLAGAMIPAGMRNVIKGLLENQFTHSIVLTGANLVHEVCEALGYPHISGSEMSDDVELANKGVSRIYDVFMENRAFEAVEQFFMETFKELSGTYSSFEIIWEIGKRLENSFLRFSYENKSPFFCPTLHDSIAGLHLMLYGKKVVLDYSKDTKMLLDLCSQKKKMGVVIVGGGVPKNFTLQAMLLADGFDYAIQITTDLPQYGGLSGATLEEAKSWCKLKSNAKAVTVYCDATIALPMLYAYLLD
ncbi:MAG: deoxyhypusine synthase [Archaeoglobaceae archaeon]|nr:deoxyhypusine synthase [Archaeoglobaceae archaeon]MDW8117795.1 deoxyhypusine synthase [Archaeoglobaceae archaeon]